MQTIKQTMILTALVIASLGCEEIQQNASVQFPDVSDAIAITSGPDEHLFASYYGINSWSADQQYATVLRTSLKDTLPTENDPATLGLVDINTHEFLPIAQIRTWNFQQGCMAHWLPTAPNSHIIYNNLVNGKFVSIIKDVLNGPSRTIPYPISAVSPDGRYAASINFARLRVTRPGYGYGGNGQDSKTEEPFPEDDGLFLVDLETGEPNLLVSIAQVRDLVPDVGNGIEYFNHTLFSRNGSQIFWLARAIPNLNTTAFVVNTDGTNLRRCFPDGWGGSHFDWLNDDELMVTAQYKGRTYGHILFTPGQDNYQRLGGGLLDYDGHGTFSPNGRWMVTDTSPESYLREQKLFLMDMQTQVVLPIGRFFEPPEFYDAWRCDLHPRWSPNGDIIGFNSTMTGSRQVYIKKLSLK